MKIEITQTGTVFEITAKLFKEGVKFPFTDEKDKTLHNEFNVRVTSVNATITFKYYNSHQDYKNGYINLVGDDLLGAFSCFVNDSMSAESSFKDFCSEFGYDEDSRKAFKIYTECKKSFKKFCAVFPVSETREAIYTYLRDKGL